MGLNDAIHPPNKTPSLTPRQQVLALAGADLDPHGNWHVKYTDEETLQLINAAATVSLCLCVLVCVGVCVRALYHRAMA